MKKLILCIILLTQSLFAQTWGEYGTGCNGAAAFGRGLPQPRVIANPKTCPTNWQVFVTSESKPDLFLLLIGTKTNLKIGACTLYTNPVFIWPLPINYDNNWKKWWGSAAIATAIVSMAGQRMEYQGVVLSNGKLGFSNGAWWIWGPPKC